MTEGVGISKRQPYGGRPHQSHCTCSYKLAEVVAENERLKAVAEAARELMKPGFKFASHYGAIADALAALDGAAGTSSE